MEHPLLDLAPIDRIDLVEHHDPMWLEEQDLAEELVEDRNRVRPLPVGIGIRRFAGKVGVTGRVREVDDVWLLLRQLELDLRLSLAADHQGVME